MTDSIAEEIERGWRVLNEGKEVEALQIANEIEKKESLTPEERLRSQILKGYLLFLTGRSDKALEIGNQTIQESINQKKPLLTVEATFIKWGALFLLSRVFESWEDVEYCEQLIKSNLLDSESEIEQAKALFLYMRSYFHYWAEEYELSQKSGEQSYEIFGKPNRYTHIRAHNLMGFGHTYGDIGELDKALEYHKRSLESKVGNEAVDIITNAVSFNSMGTIYYQKGDLSQAISHFEKSLQIFEKFNLSFYIGQVYDNLVKVSLDRNNFKRAQEYLNRFSQYNKNWGVKVSFDFYKLSQARILKSSTRTRDWTEAEKILIDLIREHKISGVEFTPGLIALCDFYFQELKLTNDLGILEDVQPLVDRFIKQAELRNSFSLRAHAFLLSGKISLLRLNMGDARRYLTKAQQISDSHGLKLLAREISHEHDKLLEQLDGLESYKKQKISMSERLNLASLDETMDLMQGKREINAPELINEEPVLLLILTGGGVLIFSHSFAEEWSFDSELFGGFLSAFNSISDEVFSEGLDRVKFGQHTVLMEPLANFSVCYLYKGQTYLAKQKLVEFIGLIQENASIEQILEKFEKTSQVIEIEDFPFLKPLITQIFKK